jgi:hypothetical protein
MHRGSLMRKLGARSMAMLARMAETLELAQLTAARSDAQHAPLRAARRRLIYGPKEGDSR